MARPRKTGLRIHKATQRYYITDPKTGKEVYLGPVAEGEARAKMKYLLWKCHNQRLLTPKGIVIRQAAINLNDPSEVFLIASPSNQVIVQQTEYEEALPEPFSPEDPAPSPKRAKLRTCDPTAA